MTESVLIYTLPKMPERLKHIVDARELSRELLEGEIFPLADEMRGVVEQGGSKLLEGKAMYNLFFLPSLVTKPGFEAGGRFLGMTVSGTEMAGQFLTGYKGGLLEDIIALRNIEEWNVIVLRHHEAGGASRAAAVSRVPIINAGEGDSQHPTQGVLDLYTIIKRHSTVGGLKLVMVGDLQYGPNVDALVYLASQYPNIRFDFIAPPIRHLKKEVRDFLTQHDIPFTQDRLLYDAVGEADVLYFVSAQRSNFTHAAKTGPYADENYKLNTKVLENLPAHAIVMHPQPRNDELPEKFDEDPRVIWKEQARNGLLIRMAFLVYLLGEK